MRQLTTLLGLFFCLNLHAQQKRNIESKIDKVTVFLNSAQVERSAKINLSAGKHELVFSGISPSLLKQSIQVKADGNITVLSVIHQHNFLNEQKKQEEIAEVETKKEALQDKITAQRNILNVYKQEETMLVKNQVVGGSNTGLKATDLKDAADFQRNRLTEVYQKQMEMERQIKKMELEMGKLNRQLFELNQKSDISTSEILVTAQVKENMNTNFSLSYLVNEAGWFPTYDVRVKDIASPIHLQYKANVSQESGEDWKDVRLFLSNGNPDEDGTRPILGPWYLTYSYAQRKPANIIQGTYKEGTVTGVITDETGNILPGVTVQIRGTRTGVAADNNGQYRIIAKPGDVLVVSGAGLESTETVVSNSGYANISMKRTVLAGTEVVVTALGTTRDRWQEPGYYGGGNHKKKKDETTVETIISYQPTTTIYEIKEPYTILNNGKTYTVEIDGYEVKATYEYYAAPKIQEDVFLTAKISDWQMLNLLPGESNLFFEGTFLGKSKLDVGNAGDTLRISLGQDKGVVVKRTLLKDFSSKKFIGSNRTDTRRYEITVRNNKQQPINIIVEDQFPVSTQKEIEVKDREYDGATLDEDTQKITWLMNIGEKKEKKVNLKYEVKYPKDKLLVID